MACDDHGLGSFGLAKQLGKNRSLEVRVKMRLRFLDAEEREIALVFLAAPRELCELQRQ